MSACGGHCLCMTADVRKGRLLLHIVASALENFCEVCLLHEVVFLLPNVLCYGRVNSVLEPFSIQVLG